MYNEHSIRILTDEELESRSPFSMFITLVEEFKDTSPVHLQRVSEALSTLGLSVSHYRSYRGGSLDANTEATMNEWFVLRNKEERNKLWSKSNL